MGISSDTAALVFKIKADSSQADAEITKFSQKLGGIGNDFASVLGPATIAASAITGIGLAAVGVTERLFDMAKSASDFGRTIGSFEAKTGLSAKAVSTLADAAHLSGKELSDIQKPIVAFNEQLVKAQNGSKEASEALRKMGVTDLKNMDVALDQLTKGFNNAAAGQDKLHAAVEIMGKKGGPDMISVMAKLKGGLAEAQKEAERMGTTLSEEDVQAAKDFGVAYDTISRQIEVGTAKFALQYAPMITDALRSISEFLANNKDVWISWGKYIADTVSGAENLVKGFEGAVEYMTGITSASLNNDKNSWKSWADNATAALHRVALAVQTGGLSELNRLADSDAGYSVGLDASKSIKDRSLKLGGGGGGGGGKGGGGGGKGPDEGAEAEKRTRRMLDEAKASFDQVEAEYDREYAVQEIDEREHIKRVAAVKLAEIDMEIDLNNKLLEVTALNGDKREAIETKIGILRTKRHTQEIENEKDRTVEEIKAIDEAAGQIAAAIRRQADQEKGAEDYRKSIRDERNKKANEQLKLLGPTDNQKDRDQQARGLNLSILGDSALSIRDSFGNLTNTLSPMLSVFQSLGDAVHGLAEGFGSLLQNIILTGTAGPHAMQKLVASVLAGVAVQAATMAIMETAYGIAALTPWGAAIYGPAPFHFKSAALFGIVAAGTGLAAHAVAGNAFKDQTNAATGGAGAAAPQNNTFETRVNGVGGSGGSGGNFLQRSQNAILEKMVAVQAATMEAVNTFNAKFNAASPSSVVVNGAGGASQEIADSYHQHLENSPAATGQLVRRLGMAT